MLLFLFWLMVKLKSVFNESGFFPRSLSVSPIQEELKSRSKMEFIWKLNVNMTKRLFFFISLCLYWEKNKKAMTRFMFGICSWTLNECFFFKNFVMGKWIRWSCFKEPLGAFLPPPSFWNQAVVRLISEKEKLMVYQGYRPPPVGSVGLSSTN